MEKMADSALRARLRKEMEAVRAWEVFGTPSYVKLMGSIARELTDGRIERVQLFCAPKEPHMGWCDGRQVAVNYGNNVTESFLTLVQKNISLAGILGHECGHKNVSILVNLCAQDALSGRINNWDNAEGELLETFQELMPVIEAGCDSEGKSGRFLAVNQALLKIWKYLYRIIQKMEAQRQDEDSTTEKEEDQEDGAEDALEYLDYIPNTAKQCLAEPGGLPYQACRLDLNTSQAYSLDIYRDGMEKSGVQVSWGYDEISETSLRIVADRNSGTGTAVIDGKRSIVSVHRMKTLFCDACIHRMLQVNEKVLEPELILYSGAESEFYPIEGGVTYLCGEYEVQISCDEQGDYELEVFCLKERR